NTIGKTNNRNKQIRDDDINGDIVNPHTL
ncbi:MAG: hypothetical protein CFH08_02386, partial [Alphaproteobacteria bacterium MarineAlpha3_Bin7]